MCLNRFLFIVSIFSGLQIHAQKETPAQEFERISAKYPKNAIVCLFREEKSVIDYFQGKLQVVTTISRENIFLDENGNLYNTARIPSSDFFPASEIKVKSLVPSGNKYKTVKGSAIMKSDNHLDGDIFHDDLVFFDVTFPDASKGNKSHLTYTEKIIEPHFFGSFFFDAPGMPTERSMVEVITPPGFELAWVYFNLDSSRVRHTLTTIKGGKLKHVWEMTDIPETKRDRGGPGYKHQAPHMVMYIKSITVNGNKENFLSDYKDLHRWYIDFIKDVNREGSTALDSMANILTKGAASDSEKVKNVFYWVQDNIKYIAFEDGLGGFVPRNAKDIFEKRYGDCKDMTSIMHYMLQKVGVPTHLTWIGTRELPYSYHQLPTPFNDNHMILTWNDAGKWYFIDGTSNFNEFGMPSSFIQGKEALVHIGKDECKIVKVPIVEAMKNSVFDTLYLRMDGSRLIGKGKAYFEGYYKQSMNRNLTNMTREETSKYMTAFLEKGSNKFMLDSLELIGKGEREFPLIAKYKFNVRDYVFVNGDEAYVNLHLDRDYLDEYIEAKRQSPIDRNFKYKHHWHFSFEIPAGYMVSKIPDNASFSHEYFSFDLKYSRNSNSVICDFSFLSAFMTLSKEYFPEWNAMIAKLNTSFKQSLVLKKIN